VAADVDVHLIRTNHDSLIKEPDVRWLARAIRDVLDHAERGPEEADAKTWLSSQRLTYGPCAHGQDRERASV
jgi:hypothetical protein